MLGQHTDRSSLVAPGSQEHQRVQGDERQAEPRLTDGSKAQEVGLHELQARSSLGAAPSSAEASSSEHGGVDVDPRDVITLGGQRNRKPARTYAQLEDRPTGPPCEGPVEVEVARVVDEVDVIQAGERLRAGLGRVAHQLREDPLSLQRTVRPAAFLAASAPMASRITRLAAIAVVSA